MTKEEILSDKFFDFIAISKYIDNNGTFLSKGQPMSIWWRLLCTELAKIAIEEVK